MSVHYLLIAPDGSIRQRGVVPSKEYLETAPEDMTVEIINPSDERAPTLRPPTYVEYRRASYPPIGDQLDVLWKFVSSLPDLPESVKAMKQQIEDTKLRFPKHD